ncbi:Aminopeptidase YpdF [bioreactor metagenome]|uniref:Aminopeptidase YpdF n=1 Tax=bioreactor metagenome TaxID=1076179 RepID=A0A644V008_9ZZZZ
MADKNLSALIVNKPENRRYFSGFTGTAGMLLISREKSFLITDFRYIEQAAMQAAHYEIVKHDINPYETLISLIKDQCLDRVGFESDFTTVAIYQNFVQAIDEENLVPVTIDHLRVIKDFKELNLIKQAVRIADDAFSHILSFLKPGVSEQDIALELEYKMRQLGAEKVAFDIIVASGVRGALPHGVASPKKIASGDLVTMDFGAVYQGYHSDITRTVCVGKATRKQHEIYDVVLKAQLAGLQEIKSGNSCQSVDSAARIVIKKHNYGEYFGHGLGHGVGLFIHEEPRLSPSNQQGVLAENMVVTVEPGIYIPEWGGVRIEDTVVVTAHNVEILTKSSKQFIELDS